MLSLSADLSGCSISRSARGSVASSWWSGSGLCNASWDLALVIFLRGLQRQRRAGVLGTWGFAAFGPCGWLAWGIFVSWSKQHSCGPAEVFVNLSVQLNYFHGALLFRGTESVPGCGLGFSVPCLSSGQCLGAPAKSQLPDCWRTRDEARETHRALAGNPAFAHFPLRGEGK